RMAGMDEASLGENVEVRIGREAIGTQRDTDAFRQKVAKGMGRMTEGGVRSRTVDDGAVVGDGCISAKVVAVRKGNGIHTVHQFQYIFRAFDKSGGVPGADLLKEFDKRPTAVAQERQFGTRLGQMDSDGHLYRHLAEREDSPTSAVRGVR